MPQALRAAVERYLIDPSLGWSDHAESWRSLAFIDLEVCGGELFDSLPPFPLIGIGDRSHPLAAGLDAVLEAPIDAATLIQQVERAPRAAAVTVQLLRALEGLPLDQALRVESLAYGLLQGSEEYAAWLSQRRPPSAPHSEDRVGEKHRPAAPASYGEMNHERAPPPPQTSEGQVFIERRDPILHVTIDRPRQRNAINRPMRDQLFEAFTLAALDSDVRSVKLRSIGEAFSAGGDLEEFGTTKDPATAHLIRSRTLPALAIARCNEKLDVHVQGACIGAGVEMSALASRVTASSTAWFQLPELAMGLIPGAGGCVSVPRRIGRQRAALMILSGQKIDARTALHWGLIDAIEDPT